MRPVRLGAWVLVGMGLAACGASAPAQPTAAAQGNAPRRRPRHRSVTQAMDRAAARASGCLPREVTSTTVTGAFVGSTGEFHVDGVVTTPESSTGVRRCVREEFDALRVEPFTEDRFEASRSFGPEGAEVASGAPSAEPTPPPTQDAVASPAPAFVPVPTPGPVANPTPPPVERVAPERPVPTTPTVHEPQRPANLRFEPPVVAGPLAPTAVDGCYRSSLRIDPTVGGRLRVRYDISTDGVARNVRADILGTPVGHMPLTTTLRCIEQRARAQAYPRSASGTVDLVITLTPPAVAHRPGGAFAIESANAGLLGMAPGLGPLGDEMAPPTEPTPPAVPSTPPAPAPGNAASAEQLQAMSTVLQGRVNEIRTCYQQQLSRDASLQLRVRVYATVQPSGAVSEVSSTAVVTAGDPDLATDVGHCVEGIVRSTLFAPHGGSEGLTATLPFLFAPDGGLAARAPGGAAPSGSGPLTGHVDAERTSQAIRARVSDVQQCYSSALGTSPNLAGRVTVQFTVDPSGRVLSPSSQTTVTSGALPAMQMVAHCIEQVLANTPLPPPVGGAAAVALPFDFGSTP